MRSHVIIAGAGFIVAGMFNTADPRRVMTDRVANGQSFPNERLLRLPRRMRKREAFSWYIRNLSR